MPSALPIGLATNGKTSIQAKSSAIQPRANQVWKIDISDL